MQAYNKCNVNVNVFGPSSTFTCMKPRDACFNLEYLIHVEELEKSMYLEIFCPHMVKFFFNVAFKTS